MASDLHQPDRGCQASYGSNLCFLVQPERGEKMLHDSESQSLVPVREGEGCEASTVASLARPPRGRWPMAKVLTEVQEVQRDVTERESRSSY
jgi:hypothetical protein